MLSHLRRWRAACAILIQPSLCYELLHTIFPTGPQPSFCLQEKWSLIATSRHSVFSSFFYMLLDAWLSALNSDFSSLCWFLGWFCFSWCSWLIPCCFLALPVNPHYLASNLYLCLSSQIQAPRNVFHSCWSTKFHSTRPHPCTDTPLKVLSPPSCQIQAALPCWLPSGTSFSSLWSSSPLEMPLWPQFGFPAICHPWTRLFLAQCSTQFHSETHPRPVSPHRLFPDKLQEASSW